MILSHCYYLQVFNSENLSTYQYWLKKNPECGIAKNRNCRLYWTAIKIWYKRGASLAILAVFLASFGTHLLINIVVIVSFSYHPKYHDVQSRWQICHNTFHARIGVQWLAKKRARIERKIDWNIICLNKQSQLVK